MRLDDWAFRHRAPLLALVTSPLVWAALAAPPPGPAALGAGAGLVLGGGALRLAAIRRLGKRARVSRAKAVELVAEGPYAWVRSPLYLAALLILLGFGLLVGLGAWALAPVAAAWLVYDRAVRHEERTLLDLHGDAAAAYVRDVPRWLPRPPASAGVTPWTEVVAREWRLAVGLPLALGAALALALTPAGVDVRAAAARLAEAADLPLPALVLGAAAAGALGNAVKTALHMERKARQRAALAGTLSVAADVRAETGS